MDFNPGRQFGHCPVQGRAHRFKNAVRDTVPSRALPWSTVLEDMCHVFTAHAAIYFLVVLEGLIRKSRVRDV